MRENLCDLGLVKDLLDITPKTKSSKEKITIWTSSKLKNCYSLKDSDMRLKTQAINWKAVFANQISDKRFCT